jgi:hypothetical protein
VQGKKVFHEGGTGTLHCFLDQENDNIDDDQVLNYGRNYLRTPQSEIGHKSAKITGCKLMF